MAQDLRSSRAVVRNIEAGSLVLCAHCDAQVKFQARVRTQQVICNVYVDGVWTRVEHYHRACYDEAGTPYGAADDSQPMRQRLRTSSAA